MLKGITWGQFSIFIMVVAGVYYLYVLLTYYRTEALGWLRRKGGSGEGTSRPGNGNRDSNAAAASGSGSGPGQEAAETGSQAELFEQEGQGSAGGGGGSGDEQFQQMQRAIAVIRQVIMQGIENNLDRENLLDHIKEVLRECRHLRRTEYAVTINNFLIRVCSSELALELGEKELAGLWK